MLHWYQLTVTFDTLLHCFMLCIVLGSQLVRLERQARALGAAMQATHSLASDKRITKAEIVKILIANIKDSKMERDERSIEAKVITHPFRFR
jgi:hypothetical protein